MPLSLGPVKKHVRNAAEEISAFSGVTNIGGWRASGSVANSDHPKGLAIDVMVGKARAKGDSIAAYVIANAERMSVTYVIWYENWWQLSTGKWEPYSHPGGNSDTLAHRDHVHVSFAAVASGIGGSPIQPSTGQPVDEEGIGAIGAVLLGSGAAIVGTLVMVGLVAFVLWKGVKR